MIAAVLWYINRISEAVSTNLKSNNVTSQMSETMWENSGTNKSLQSHVTYSHPQISLTLCITLPILLDDHCCSLHSQKSAGIRHILIVTLCFGSANTVELFSYIGADITELVQWPQIYY